MIFHDTIKFINSNNKIVLIIIYTAMCGLPFCLSRSVSDLAPRVITFSDHPNTVNFSCPLGFVLSGPSSTMCMSNRQWQPDPSSVECNEGIAIFVFNYF